MPVLETRLRGLHPDPGNLLVHLDVTGTLSPQGLQAFERDIRGGVGSALCALRIDDAGLRLQPSAFRPGCSVTGREWSGLSPAASPRVPMTRPTPQRDLAQAALQRLYVLHASQERSA